MQLADLHTVSRDELLAEFRRQASHTVMSVASLQDELQRRGTEELIEATRQIGAHAADLEAASARLTAATEQVLHSSRRLEKLTKYLLALTILLLIAAVPPAIEAISHYFSPIKPVSLPARPK